MVSMEDFEELQETVRVLRQSMGSIEADNNDVINGMEELSTCMSGFAGRFDGTEATPEPPITTRATTTMDPTMNPATTATTTEEPTMSPTRTATTEEPTMSPTRTATTEEPTMSPTRTATTTKEPTMSPTRTATTTKEPTYSSPTMSPTESWEALGFLIEGGDNKCSSKGSDRAFRLDFTSVENCLIRCSADESCKYATTNHERPDDAKIYCIGCIVLNRKTSGWTAYETYESRRQLTEVERLHAENAALREELAKVRRN